MQSSQTHMQIELNFFFFRVRTRVVRYILNRISTLLVRASRCIRWHLHKKHI